MTIALLISVFRWQDLKLSFFVKVSDDLLFSGDLIFFGHGYLLHKKNDFPVIL